MSDSPELSAEQLDTLRHMLGINTPNDARPKPYRDYYCAPKDYEPLKRLAELGMVMLCRQDNHDWYTTTDEGRKRAMESHVTIRHTKRQRVYSTFLNVRDVFPSLTFKDFLTNPEFSQVRSEA